MTTSEQLIEFLKQYPGAEIEVLVNRVRGYEVYAEWETLDLEYHTNIIDVRKKSFTDPPFQGKVYIRLGER